APDRRNRPVEELWNVVVPWFGRPFLGITREITTGFNGSGDRTFDWVDIVLKFSLAAFAALVWSIADRRRLQYRWLRSWLHVYLRYVLATSMLSYGVSKLFKLQFPYLQPRQLLEPFGG